MGEQKDNPQFTDLSSIQEDDQAASRSDDATFTVAGSPLSKYMVAPAPSPQESDAKSSQVSSADAATQEAAPGSPAKVVTVDAATPDPTADPDSTGKGISLDLSPDDTFVAPIRTSMSEFELWFNNHALRDRDIIKNIIKEKDLPRNGKVYSVSDTEILLHELFEKESSLYWNFRNWQAQQLANPDDAMLQRLGLKLKPNQSIDPKQPLTIDQFDDLKPSEKSSLQDRVNYLNKMRDMYQGIKIAPYEEKDKNNKIGIFYTDPNTNKDLSLVEITYGKTSIGNQPSIIFKINDTLDEKKLDQAVLLMLDQARRTSEVTCNNYLTIYGYEKNPERALQLLTSIKKSGGFPNIEPATLEAWKKNATEAKDPTEKAKFENALKMYHQQVPQSRKINPATPATPKPKPKP